MSKVNIANFVEINHWVVSDDSERDEGNWVTQYRFQNANTQQALTHNGYLYTFLSFIYEGATRTRTGDNIQAGLVVSTNPISVDYAYDIVMMDFSQSQHHIKRQIKVETVLMDNAFINSTKTLTTEYWVGASMNYDAEMVEITLASAVDAVFAGLPGMYLDENNVGRLPTTSRINTA